MTDQASFITAAWLQAGAGVLSVAAMVWLAWLTRAYARDTRNAVAEMRAGREASAAPSLVISLVRTRTGDPGAPMPCLANAGVGPALDVAVKLRYTPGGPEWSLNHSFVGAGDFVITEPEDADWRNRNIGKFPAGMRLEAEGTCRTVFDTTVAFRRSFEVAVAHATVVRTEQQKGART